MSNRGQNNQCQWSPFTLLMFLVTFTLASSSALAQTFVSGSTGVDGPFNPTATTTIDLPPNGVFNFTTVNIPAGVTVTFNRNAVNTPVFILASGDVTIDGTIDLSGIGVTAASPVGGAGGPGGFGGGSGGIVAALTGGSGLGPGGAGASSGAGGGGGFGVAGALGEGGTGGPVYGTDFLSPLIGGSGGAGGGASSSSVGAGGGGGGGALLIASSGTITIGSSGRIKLNGRAGGSGASGGNFNCGGGGSGGGVRLIANTFVGNGSGLEINGGSASFSLCVNNGGAGGRGRGRVEFFTQNVTAPFANFLSLGQPGPVFVPGIPTLAITSIGGVAVPVSPSGSFVTPDLSLPPTTTNPVTVALSATNIPVGTIVAVFVIPQRGTKTTVDSTPLAGTQASSNATAQMNLPVGTGTSVVLAAQASFTIQQANLDLPTVNGEKIAKVQVGATLGGGSTLTYITETGKEIPASQLQPLVYTRLEGSGVKQTSP